jgi:hypothetical protein
MAIRSAVAYKEDIPQAIESTMVFWQPRGSKSLTAEDRPGRRRQPALNAKATPGAGKGSRQERKPPGTGETSSRALAVFKTARLGTEAAGNAEDDHRREPAFKQRKSSGLWRNSATNAGAGDRRDRDRQRSGDSGTWRLENGASGDRGQGAGAGGASGRPANIVADLVRVEGRGDVGGFFGNRITRADADNSHREAGGFITGVERV